jgi:hypothetical protein
MAHEAKRTFTELVKFPAHKKRTASPEFQKNKDILVKQLNLPCFICDNRGIREVHHVHEWALWEALDPKKVLNTLHIFDPYGFTNKMGETPLESPDDIRNLMVLCGHCEINGVSVPGGHHRGTNAGVHHLTFPVWLAQRAVKPGMSITKGIERMKQVDEKLREKISKT